MRNAIFSSVPPQLYNFGNNEIQMPNLDISMQIDSLVTNVHRNSSFSMDSKIFKDDDSQLRSGGFPVSCQSLFNYPQGGFQPFSTSYDDIISQKYCFSQKRPHPQFELDFQSLQNAIEVNNFVPREFLVHNKKTSNVYKKNQNKKMKTSPDDQNWLHDHHQIKNSSTKSLEQRVPVRRSQKMSDKITALQKLVSPYGKVTDTASVLQEASLYIKLLQDQIKNLFQMLSSSYKGVSSLHSQEMGEKESDLRSRGLCLVPISVTQKLKKNQDLLVDSHSISRKTTMP